jgi:cytochrome c553
VRKFTDWWVIGLAALVIAAPSVLVAGKGEAEAGKVVYDKKCAACHGKEGEGKEAIAKSLKVELRHLGSKEVQEKSDEVLRKESVDGVGKMKAVKGMSEEDIVNLMAYLRTLKQK